jgi:hypothetical protein
VDLWSSECPRFAANLMAPSGTKVVVYYSDDQGQKAVHFFKRVSK